MKTYGQLIKDLKEKDEIEMLDLIPLKDLLLGLENVRKDKECKEMKTPYLKAEILIPHNVATSIPTFINSKWRVAILFLKLKEEK